MVRAYFAITSRVLPDLARRHAERLFTMPPRYAGRSAQAADARHHAADSRGDAQSPRTPLGVRFAAIDRIEELEQLRLPALFVHDSGDAEVPFEHALRLSGRMPAARLIRTYGLGHYRVLRSPAVVGAVVDFVSGNDLFGVVNVSAFATGLSSSRLSSRASG